MRVTDINSERRILLCGARKDVHLKWVATEISNFGGEAIILDLLAGDSFSDQVAHGAERTQVSGIDLESFSSAWSRLKIKLDPVFVEQEDRAKYFYEKEALHQYRGLLERCEQQGIFVANSGRASYRAFHKPFQLSLAQRCGLQVPETLATNELNEAAAFAEKYGDIAVKVYDTPFIKGDSDEPNRYIFTSRISPKRLAAVGKERFSQSVSQLQRYISKAYELRVICSASFCHAIKIDSQSVDTRMTDWRRSEFLPFYSPTEIDDGLLGRLRRYLDESELAYGVFDLIIDPSGSPWFLECNPDGQWAMAQRATGQNIARSFAQMLLQA